MCIYIYINIYLLYLYVYAHRGVLSRTGPDEAGDVVTAIVHLGKLAATYQAFAFHGHGGDVVTWGAPKYGGQPGARGAEERSAYPSNSVCFCCHS